MDRADFTAIVTDPSAGWCTGTQSNMSEQSDRKTDETAKLPPPTRAQRLAAAGFLGAFGLTILTVLLTGLKVGAPAARRVFQPAPVTAASSAPAPADTGSAAPAAAPPAPAALSPTALSPTAPSSSTGDPKTSDDAARDDAERERADATHKASRKNAGDRPSNDAR